MSPLLGQYLNNEDLRTGSPLLSSSSILFGVTTGVYSSDGHSAMFVIHRVRLGGPSLIIIGKLTAWMSIESKNDMMLASSSSSHVLIDLT